MKNVFLIVTKDDLSSERSEHYHAHGPYELLSEAVEYSEILLRDGYDFEEFEHVSVYEATIVDMLNSQVIQKGFAPRKIQWVKILQNS